jgi:hypothetical protein
MARQNISNGSAANDGTGDTLRAAATKINETFVEIYQKFGGGDSDNLSSQLSFGSDGIIFEGSSANDFETTLKVTNPTSDNTITFPDSTGDVILTNTIQTLTNKSVSFQTSTITANGTADATATVIICNKGSGLLVALGDGSHPGQLKIFTNKGVGAATITPTNFAGGTSFALAQNEGATCIWDGSNWFLVGNQSVTTIV